MLLGEIVICECWKWVCGKCDHRNRGKWSVCKKCTKDKTKGDKIVWFNRKYT